MTTRIVAGMLVCVVTVAGCAGTTTDMTQGASPAGPGAADGKERQRTDDPCSFAPGEGGRYCLNALIPDARSAELYVCERGVTSQRLSCPNGCGYGADGAAGLDDECVAQAPTQPQQPIQPQQPGAEDPCKRATLGNGGYCAAALDSGSRAPKLYTCTNGQTTAIVDCPNGCQINAPGVSDTCVGQAGETVRQTASADPPATRDPCASASLGNGGYCAASLDATSTAATLYTCVNRQTTAAVQCPAGCQIMPPGISDVCAGTSAGPTAPATGWDPCANANLGNGGYCSASLDPTSNEQTLYTCVGGRTASAVDCPAGCQIMPPGQNDVCGSDGGGSSPPIQPSGGSCDQTAPFTCGGTLRACKSGSCQACSAGYYNCNGTYECECKGGCNGSKCATTTSPTVCISNTAFSCGSASKWCFIDTCQLCSSGYYNCDGKGGCECRGGCSGTSCAACSPSTAWSCGNRDKWCYSGGGCRTCSAGYYNCDGKDGCECKGGCDGTRCKATTTTTTTTSTCSPTKAWSCGGTSKWCMVDTCRTCQTGWYNCDGLNTCGCRACNGTKCK